MGRQFMFRMMTFINLVQLSIFGICSSYPIDSSLSIVLLILTSEKGFFFFSSLFVFLMEQIDGSIVTLITTIWLTNVHLLFQPFRTVRFEFHNSKMISDPLMPSYSIQIKFMYQFSFRCVFSSSIWNFDFFFFWISLFSIINKRIRLITCNQVEPVISTAAAAKV